MYLITLSSMILQVDDVTAVLNQLLLIDNIAEQAFEVSQNG